MGAGKFQSYGRLMGFKVLENETLFNCLHSSRLSIRFRFVVKLWMLSTSLILNKFLHNFCMARTNFAFLQSFLKVIMCASLSIGGELMYCVQNVEWQHKFLHL
jgi:hypothetical protein